MRRLRAFGSELRRELWGLALNLRAYGMSYAARTSSTIAKALGAGADRGDESAQVGRRDDGGDGRAALCRDAEPAAFVCDTAAAPVQVRRPRWPSRTAARSRWWNVQLRAAALRARARPPTRLPGRKPAGHTLKTGGRGSPATVLGAMVGTDRRAVTWWALTPVEPGSRRQMPTSSDDDGTATEQRRRARAGGLVVDPPLNVSRSPSSCGSDLRARLLLLQAVPGDAGDLRGHDHWRLGRTQGGRPRPERQQVVDQVPSRPWTSPGASRRRAEIRFSAVPSRIRCGGSSVARSCIGASVSWRQS